MEKKEVLFSNQLIKSLEEAEKKLEKAYERGDYEDFDNSKKIMIRIQAEISEMLK